MPCEIYRYITACYVVNSLVILEDISRTLKLNKYLFYTNLELFIKSFIIYITLLLSKIEQNYTHDTCLIVFLLIEIVDWFQHWLHLILLKFSTSYTKPLYSFSAYITLTCLLAQLSGFLLICTVVHSESITLMLCNALPINYGVPRGSGLEPLL